MFKLVPFREVAEFVQANSLRHFVDASEIADHEMPNIDMEYYLQASDAGACFAVVCEEDGEIIAYSVFMVANAPNHAHVIEANNTGIWVRSDKRGRLSYELVRQSEKLLFAMADEISYTVPSDKLGGFLGQLGYRSQYTIWSTRK